MVDVMFNAGRFTNGVADAWSPRADDGLVSIGEYATVHFNPQTLRSFALTAVFEEYRNFTNTLGRTVFPVNP